VIKEKQHIVICVTNELTYDQRMQRIAGSLSKVYTVTLIGREKPDAASLPHLTDVHLYRLPCRFVKGKLFYMEYQLRLFFFLFKYQWDVVYAVDLDTIWGAFSIASLRSKIRIYDAHEYFTELPEVIDRPLTRLIWRITARWWIPRAHQCITVNEALAKEFERRYDKPFASIRNMPKRQQLTPVHEDTCSTKVLLYQGALNVGRGLEAMIDLMTELPDYECWFAGEGDLSVELRKRAANSVAHNRIRFLGYLTPEDLRRVTPKAYIGLNLLQGDSANYYYSLANKFFDYVQAGLPQISMNYPVYCSLMLDFKVGILVDSLSTHSLLTAINEIGSDYSGFSAACALAAQEWNWEKEEVRLLDVFAG